jgi:hypothetical protein
MSTLKETTIAMGIYYLVIFGGRELMRNRPAFRFDALFKLHNFGLTVLSGTLLVLFLEQLIPTLMTRGVYHAVCDRAGGWTQPLVLLYYVRPCRTSNERLTNASQLNYLTKYVEFIDTCFLFLRKKPLCKPMRSRYFYMGRINDQLSFPPHLPPRRHGTTVLPPIIWWNSRFLGSYSSQLGSSLPDVL